jgi:capsid protein
VAALAATHTDLRTKSRDLVRRNAWAQAGIEALVANVVGTGIKPQTLSPDERSKASVQALWRDWCEEADAAGLTDFYGPQGLARRAMLEGGECLIRLRPRRTGSGWCIGWSGC